MNSSKKLIKRYFKTPLWIKLAIVFSTLAILTGLYFAGTGFSNEVPKNKQKDYVNYNGAYLRAGDKAYLDVTGISESISYRDGRHFHIVMDEKIKEDEWYYYIVLLNDETFDKMSKQQKFYDDENSEAVSFRLWGTIISPSSAFVDEVCEYLDMEYTDYYDTFGDTYLSVNTSNETKVLLVSLITFISFFILVASLIMLLVHKTRVSKMIRMLKTYLLLDRAADELGKAPVSNADPIFTRNFLFNRKTVTTAFMPDVIMVDQVNNVREHILAGYLRQGLYVALAGKDASQYPEIINRIRECNSELMTEYNSANMQKYSEIVNEGKATQ